MTEQQARTFADMTPEERDQCRGTWCEVDRLDGVYILLSISDTTADLYDPREDMFTCGFPEEITPRFDLPRAWNPDGTPVVADPEEYTVDGRSRVYFEGIEKVAFPPGAKVRRWVSDWEAVE